MNQPGRRIGIRYLALAAGPLLGALTLASQAQANATFDISGNGISVNASFALVTDLLAGNGLYGQQASAGYGYVGLGDPSNAQLINGASGTFSDAKLGLSSVGITGVITDNNLPHFDSDTTIPASFSWWTGVGGPAFATLSYDELYYASGAPMTCEGVPGGAMLDDYGVLLTLANGDLVGVWGNGEFEPRLRRGGRRLPRRRNPRCLRLSRGHTRAVHLGDDAFRLRGSRLRGLSVFEQGSSGRSLALQLFRGSVERRPRRAAFFLP